MLNAFIHFGKKMRFPYLSFLFILFIFPCDAQWGFSPEQSEVYDLVDETGINFYEFLGISQDASTADVRRSYRKLSLTMHPDKNKTEGAEEGFRILVAVYEILKSKEKREIYNDVLEQGLPSAYLYVPRQIRKMGMLEVSVIISLIVTLGHFLFMWGSYFEKRLTMDEYITRQKGRRKKGVIRENDDEALEELRTRMEQKPVWKDVLPVLLLRKLFAFTVAIPGYIRNHQEQKRFNIQLEEERKREEELTKQALAENLEKRKEAKRFKQERTKKKREEMELAKKLAAESGPMQPSVFENSSQSLDELEAMYDEMEDDRKSKKKVKKSDWDDQDQSELAKLMSKYPRGSTERWPKIAREMGRSVQEVTSKATQAKDYVGSKAKYSAATVPNQPKTALEISDAIISRRFDAEDAAAADESDAIQTRDNSTLPSENEEKNIWDQTQQKLLESALVQFPKSTPERWEKITDIVIGKTKEECVARYKYIAENMRKRRQQKS